MATPIFKGSFIGKLFFGAKSLFGISLYEWIINIYPLPCTFERKRGVSMPPFFRAKFRSNVSTKTGG